MDEKPPIYIRLPEPIKAPLRRVRDIGAAVARRTGLREGDWLYELNRGSRKIRRRLRSAGGKQPPGRQRVLFWSMIPWAQGGVEHILSRALALRGHEVHSVVCGGLLPDCELHYHDFARPPCDECFANALRFTNAFGISPIASTDHISENDVAQALEAVRSLDENGLKDLVHDGIPVGEIARFHVNVFYQTFLMELDPVQLEQFRQFTASAILLSKIAVRLLDRLQPDIVVASNGKAFTYRPMFLAARQRGIRVTTWEEHAFDNTLKFVFNHNTFAGEIHLENIWPEISDQPLTAEQDARLDHYFERWRKDEITPFAYHQTEGDRLHSPRQILGIPPDASVVLCLPNMVRDTAAFDRDVAFNSLIDWIFRSVDYAAGRPALHLVIRAHPAERVLPPHLAKYNRFFVCEEVRRRYPDLPNNVHLVEGDSSIRSYDLIEEADVIAVYTSTLGLECALAGRRAWVAGDTHYRDKGFTSDIEQQADLWDFLDSGPPFDRTIDHNQISLARRYAYAWRFRHPIAMPFYDPDKQTFKIPDFAQLGPGGNQTIDRLCERILTGGPFIDLEADASASDRGDPHMGRKAVLG